MPMKSLRLHNCVQIWARGGTLLKTKMTHMFVSVSGWPSLSPQTLVPLCEESGPTMSWLCPVAARGGYSKDFSTIKCRIIFVFKLLWNISNQWLCKWLWENIVKYRKHDKKLPIISYFHDKKVEVYPPLADGDVTLDIEHWPQPGWPLQDPGPPHGPHAPRHANNQKLRILSQRMDHFWILVLITNFPHMSVTRPPCNTCLKSHFWHMITGWLIRIM